MLKPNACKHGVRMVRSIRTPLWDTIRNYRRPRGRRTVASRGQRGCVTGCMPELAQQLAMRTREALALNHEESLDIAMGPQESPACPGLWRPGSPSPNSWSRSAWMS
jgi:hypothetical protein